eukprot:3261492-Amphidinium_carterae.1
MRNTFSGGGFWPNSFSGAGRCCNMFSAKKQSGVTRVAHPHGRAFWPFKDLQAHILDDETWFSDVQHLKQPPREVPVAILRWKLWGRMVKPPLCQWIASRRTCKVPTMMNFLGRCWNNWVVLMVPKCPASTQR